MWQDKYYFQQVPAVQVLKIVVISGTCTPVPLCTSTHTYMLHKLIYFKKININKNKYVEGIYVVCTTCTHTYMCTCMYDTCMYVYSSTRNL